MPLSKNDSVSKWIHDFTHSNNKKFSGDTKNQRTNRALGAYYSKQNEEMSFDELRDTHIREGLNHLRERISHIEIEPKEIEETPVVNEVSEEEKKETLSLLGDRAHKIYREKIKPRDTTKPDVSEPETMATREQRKAALNAALHIRNGGSEGKLSPTGENGGNTGSAGHSINTGLYPCTLTIEEYEEFINEKFQELRAKEEVAFAELQEEEERPNVVAILKEALLQLEDTSWQCVDALMREVARENEVEFRQLRDTFKKSEGMLAESWIRENRILEKCGVFPLDEIVRINKIGQVYDVTLIWRGGTHRLKFFWPETKQPSKSDMQSTVEKFYPGGKLLTYYINMQGETGNSMIYMAPRHENYEVYTEDNWGFMSEESTKIYEEICAEEGEPLSAPYLVEENLYEMKIEDHETGEERVVRFEEVGERGAGKSFLNK
jgi:hypothetical protein